MTPNDQNRLSVLDLDEFSWVFHAREVLEPILPGLTARADEANQKASELAAARQAELNTLQASRAQEDEATVERRRVEDENTAYLRGVEDEQIDAKHNKVPQAQVAAKVARAVMLRVQGVVAALKILEGSESLTLGELQSPAQRVFTQLLGNLAEAYAAFSGEEPVDDQVYYDILSRIGDPDSP